MTKTPLKVSKFSSTSIPSVLSPHVGSSNVSWQLFDPILLKKNILVQKHNFFLLFKIFPIKTEKKNLIQK